MKKGSGLDTTVTYVLMFQTSHWTSSKHSRRRRRISSRKCNTAKKAPSGDILHCPRLESLLLNSLPLEVLGIDSSFRGNDSEVTPRWLYVISSSYSNPCSLSLWDLVMHFLSLLCFLHRILFLLRRQLGSSFLAKTRICLRFMSILLLCFSSFSCFSPPLTFREQTAGYESTYVL